MANDLSCLIIDDTLHELLTSFRRKFSHVKRCPDRKWGQSLLAPASTLTSVLTMGIGNTVMGTVSNNALWSLAK